MNPSAKLILPFIDPPTSRRATTIGQMYVRAVEGDWNFIHEVGTPFAQSVTVHYTNVSVSHTLRFNVSVPDFVSSSQSEVVIPPRGSSSITFTMNADNVRTKTFTSTRQFVDTITVKVEPIGVNGPVFVVSA